MRNRKLWNRKTGPITCFGRCKAKYNEVIKHLGKEHFVEDDPTRTHSGTERYWVFEICEGVALAFQYHDVTEELYIGSNKELDKPYDIAYQFIPFSLEKVNGEMWS